MIIDIGANFGEFCIEIAKRNSNQLVIAIEPIPELCSKINTMIEMDNISNLKVLQYAVDTTERVDCLNVAAHNDWGVSSLLKFDESKIKEDEYWQTRTDMYFDKRIEVHVKTLESILDELSINENIDFIKIDAQGLDFNVLQSAGKYINSINAGMIEVSVSTKFGLYQNENYDLRIILNWLEDNYFESYALKPNDPASNEFNLYFYRKGINFFELESSIHLKNLNLYDGKFYWHYPSNKLENIDLILNNLNADLQRHINLVDQKDKIIENLDADLRRHINLVDQKDKIIENINADLRRHIDLVQIFESGILYRFQSKILNLLKKLNIGSKND
jgi:FkbM family methyltransferase